MYNAKSGIHSIKNTSHTAGGESVITNSTHVQWQIWNPFKTTSQYTAGGESVITNSTQYNGPLTKPGSDWIGLDRTGSDRTNKTRIGSDRIHKTWIGSNSIKQTHIYLLKVGAFQIPIKKWSRNNSENS